LFGSDWDIVYLASFPRSGNHWVRFLVEDATDIATSSIYKDLDYPHLPARFPWKGYCPDHGYKGNCRYPTEQDPVLLKIHYPYIKKIPQPIGRATICLIRNPVDAFYSLYVYWEVEMPRYKVPTEVVSYLINKWREFYEFWEKQPGVLLVRYEDLYEDPVRYLSEIIQTIGYQVQPEDIQRAVAKNPPKGGILKHIDHFSTEDLELIRYRLKDLMVKYGYTF
jgi:hypothetical protein